MDQIEEVKQKTDITELISEYVPLKRAGRNFKGLCPFHGEKTPSFMVNPELQIYKCFGCGEGGDALAFVQKMEGIEFGEALKMLAKRAGVTLVSYRPTQGEEVKEKLLAINHLAAEAYHFLLTKHESGKRALEYVLKRGISREAIEKFKLGYAPDEWEFLNSFLVKKKNYKYEDLLRVGLVVEGRNYDRFRNRVMFPLANVRGHVVGFAGRVMPGADEKAGGKYVNTPETEIYHKGDLLYGLDTNKGEIKTAGCAVVVEGEIDAIASWQAGIKNVVAIKGSALTEKQVESLRRICDRVIMALDADLAGNMAARRGIELAEKAGVFVDTINWGEAENAKDVADVAMAEPVKWQEMVKNTISIYSFYISSAVKKYGISADGKTRVAREVIPFINIISDAVRKDEYLKELAKKIEVEVEALREQLSKNITSTPTPLRTSKPEEIKNSRRDLLEGYLVGLVVNDKKWDKLTELKPLFTEGFWKRVVLELDAVRDVKKLPAELRDKVEVLAFGESEWSEKEWDKAKRSLELDEIQVSLTRGEKPQDVDKLAKRKALLTKDR